MWKKLCFSKVLCTFCMFEQKHINYHFTMKRSLLFLIYILFFYKIPEKIAWALKNTSLLFPSYPIEPLGSSFGFFTIDQQFG